MKFSKERAWKEKADSSGLWPDVFLTECRYLN